MDSPDKIVQTGLLRSVLGYLHWPVDLLLSVWIGFSRENSFIFGRFIIVTGDPAIMNCWTFLGLVPCLLWTYWMLEALIEMVCHKYKATPTFNMHNPAVWHGFTLSAVWLNISILILPRLVIGCSRFNIGLATLHKFSMKWVSFQWNHISLFWSSVDISQSVPFNNQLSIIIQVIRWLWQKFVEHYLTGGNRIQDWIYSTVAVLKMFHSLTHWAASVGVAK